jgi:hypothetical protein
MGRRLSRGGGTDDGSAHRIDHGVERDRAGQTRSARSDRPCRRCFRLP